MKRLRIVLLPLGMAAEAIAAFATCLVAIFSVSRAERMCRWCISAFTSIDWYAGKHQQP